MLANAAMRARRALMLALVPSNRDTGEQSASKQRGCRLHKCTDKRTRLPVRLRSVPLERRQTRVIGRRAQARILQPCRHIRALRARAAIHNCCRVAVAALERFQILHQHVLGPAATAFGTEADEQVVAEKTCLEHCGAGRKLERARDVAPHLAGGCGGEGGHRHAWQLLAQLAELAVVWPACMLPSAPRQICTHQDCNSGVTHQRTDDACACL